MDTHDDKVRERANSLYWDSDDGVNDIADTLDLSKGALYGMIEPLDAGLACPECSGAMQYTNRTARDRGMVTCPDCGMEEEADLVEAAALDVAEEVSFPNPREGLHPPSTVPLRTLVASTLIGIAAGVAIGQLTRRR